jgi:hypothetical protein
LDQVLPKALEKARTLGKFPPKAFETIKMNRVEQVEAQIRKHLVEKEKIFFKCWYSERTREILKEAMKKF